MILMSRKKEYIYLKLIHTYHKSKVWLLERFNVLYHVVNNKPDGVVANKFWVEDEEWNPSNTVEVSTQYTKEKDYTVRK